MLLIVSKENFNATGVDGNFSWYFTRIKREKREIGSFTVKFFYKRNGYFKSDNGKS